jgi:outer membrane protein OmpA-like peptidoglycan-associated protein
MEKLMLTNAQVSDDDLTALGNQRAQAAKEWLVDKGQVPADRIFIVASKSGPGGSEAAKAKLSRVDFSLKH